MPIAVFQDLGQLKKWCEDTVSPDRFRVLSTDEDEIILEPTKTSRPLKFGYLQISKAQEFAESLAKEFGLKHIHLKAYRWMEDRGPFVKVAPEE